MSYPYARTAYANAFNGIAPVIRIDCLETWAMLRIIPGTDLRDAIALYPLAWPSQPKSRKILHAELEAQEIVTLTLAVDPRCDAITDGWLPEIFDVARPYKDHFVVDPRKQGSVSAHHRRNVRYASRHCEVREIALSDHLDEWCDLYNHLISRHDLKGVHRFSRGYFEQLCRLPELRMFGAFVMDKLVAASLWLTWNNKTMLHLTAANDEGYQTRAAFGLFDFAIHHFEGAETINLGGAADVSEARSPGSDGLPGLARFKSGFASGTLRSWICGTVVDRAANEKLCESMAINAERALYFPAYRA